MKKKKILAIIILFIVIGLIIFGVYLINKNIAKSNKSDSTKEVENSIYDDSEKKTSDKTTNIVMNDTVFLAQLNDIYMNFNEYNGKTIEIEGFPMVNGKYTFIGRYSPGCPYCSGSYAYIEYEYDGDIELTPEKDWIKIIGKLKKGNDGTEEYIYIQVSSIEKMETRGTDTVK